MDGAPADPIWTRALELLRATPRLSKRRVPGAVLTTGLDGPDLLPAEVLAQASAMAQPDRATLQAVIWALDLIAVGGPDQRHRQIDPDVQQVAGKLRERFSRSYKQSAYAEARAAKNN